MSLNSHLEFRIQFCRLREIPHIGLIAGTRVIFSSQNALFGKCVKRINQSGKRESTNAGTFSQVHGVM